MKSELRSFILIVIFISASVQSQEIDMKLINTIAVDKHILTHDTFSYFDKKIQVQVIFDKQELVEMLTTELDKLGKSNRFYSASKELIDLISHKEYLHKSNFNSSSQLECFNYIMADLIDRNKVEIWLNEHRASIVDRYEIKEFSKKDNHYVSYFIYRIGNINFFEILNYEIIE